MTIHRIATAQLSCARARDGEKSIERKNREKAEND